MTSFVAFNRSQAFLLPADLKDWLPEDDVAHLVVAAVDRVPFGAFRVNPQENVWQFMRDNWLSSRVFDDADALLDHCCDAWNKLEAKPWTIMSIARRDWAHGS